MTPLNRIASYSTCAKQKYGRVSSEGGRECTCRLYVVCPVPISAVIFASKPSERIGISGVWNGFFITASA